MKMLVAIASYGTGNDDYLARLIREYHSMSFPVDIVVLSNVEKNLGSGVEVVVGLPYVIPWTLPFPHKQIFADRLNDYDLFLYSEDDMLITERNICAFLEASQSLPENEVPGFLRFEESAQGRNYPEFHGHFHWDTASVHQDGDYTSAFFTNEHAGCYLLTRAQLKRAIESGGYLVGPHAWKYDLLCSAATDPYTQCGVQKVICISHIDDFLIHHLPNKYVGTEFGIGENEFRRQVQTLLEMAKRGERNPSLFPTESKIKAGFFSKGYYERPPEQLASILPVGVRTVLSIGSGCGATEAWLASKGLKVTAVPLDSVISSCTEATGVEIVHGGFAAVQKQLAGRTFDCLLLLNVLHLVEDPVALLASFEKLLSKGSVVISLVPNMARTAMPWSKARRDGIVVVDYEKSGAHYVSLRVIRSWFNKAGMRVKDTVRIMTPRAQSLSDLVFGLADSSLTSEFISISEFRG